MDLNASFHTLLESARVYLPQENFEPLIQAFEFSKKAHAEQNRAGGDPFVTHPLAVAQILAEFHLDLPTLTAALLHDVLEDTTVPKEELLAKFGPEVTHMVEGVTKIDSLPPPNPQTEGIPSQEIIKRAENWRKMLIATAQDIRVVILKLADRKHNMETLQFLSPEKQHKIAEETITLYAPLAQRMGIYQIKASLEDLSLKYLEPKAYGEFKKKIHMSETRQAERIKGYAEKIEALLKDQPFFHRISARSKSLYSLYKKIQRQQKPFEEIQDFLALRVLTDTVEHCYAVLGIIQSQYIPVPNSFTDYITMPKSNLYQSLHTTIQITPKEIVEVQIRTEEMHRIAEFGIAAHWRYKLGNHSASTAPVAKPQKDSFENKLDWFKQVLEWQKETDNPAIFLEELKTHLEFDEVFVFTPKGDVIKLLNGSTPIDFAYAIHSDLGNLCVGAKVNDKMVRLDTVLKSGDRCEIQTRKGQHPHKDWLDLVKTPRARSKIRKYFRETEK